MVVQRRGPLRCVFVLLFGKAEIHRDVAVVRGTQNRAGRGLASRHHEQRVRHVFSLKTKCKSLEQSFVAVPFRA